MMRLAAFWVVARLLLQTTLVTAEAAITQRAVLEERGYAQTCGYIGGNSSKASMQSGIDPRILHRPNRDRLSCDLCRHLDLQHRPGRLWVLRQCDVLDPRDLRSSRNINLCRRFRLRLQSSASMVCCYAIQTYASSQSLMPAIVNSTDDAAPACATYYLSAGLQSFETTPSWACAASPTVFHVIRTAVGGADSSETPVNSDQGSSSGSPAQTSTSSGGNSDNGGGGGGLNRASEIAAIVGTIVGVIALILAIIFGVNQWRKKHPRYEPAIGI